MASSNVSSVVNLIPTVNEGFITTVGGGGVSSGGSAVPLTTTSGLTNGSVFVGIIEPGAAAQQVFTGTVDTGGTQITGVKWTRGTNAAHLAGVTVVDYVTGTAINMISRAILVDHSQTGGHEIATNFDPSNPTLETQKWVGVAAAVNEITVTNAATGNAPGLSVTGGDTNANLSATGKGTGGFIAKNPYKFSAYRTAAWTDGNSTFVKVAYDTKEYDTGNNFDVTTNIGRFTAPINGFYGFNATVSSTVTGGQIGNVALAKNGSIVKQGTAVDQGVANVGMGRTVVATLLLVAGDYVEVQSYGSGGGGTIGGSATYFQGEFKSVT